MFKNSKWLSILLFIIAVVILIELYRVSPGAEKEVPAWIQAGGSILAIIASFGIADWSRASEQRSRRKDVFAVIQAAHQYAQKIRIVVDGSKPSERMVNLAIHNLYHRSITDGFARALANIPFHEVGTSEAVAAIVDMQVQFERFMPNSLEVFIAGPQNHQSFKDAQTELDISNYPERFNRHEELYEMVFKTLANNVRGNLIRIEDDFQRINEAMG